MNARTPHRAFQNQGFFQNCGARVGFIGENFPQLLGIFDVFGRQTFFIRQSARATEGCFEQPIELDAGLVGHEFDHRICIIQGQIHDSSNVFDGHFCRHCAVSDNLRHLLFAVFLNHVINNFLATFIVKIGVNIGHGFSVRIQKTFKQKVVFYRVNVRNADAIRHRTPRRRTTTGSNKDAQISSRLDKIRHNQEITRKTHCFDGKKFKIQAFFDFLRDVFVAFACAFVSDVAEVFVLVRKGLRNDKIGQHDVLFELQQLHFIHNFVGVINRFRHIFEKCRHFARCFKIKFIVRKSESSVLFSEVVVHAKVIHFGR